MPAPALSLAWSNPQVQPRQASVPSQADDALDDLPEPDLEKFRAQFQDYAGTKADEIDERRTAARYYYSQQYTDDQIKTLAARGQPPIVFNLIDSVVDGTVGVLQRSRGEPQAVPRTPRGGEGAELATQCLRFALDQSDWREKEGTCLRQAYSEGLAVSAIEEVVGDMGDPDYEIEDIDPTTFYYDPRSIRVDFADAEFMGVSRWATPSQVDELFPGKAADVSDALSSGSALTTAFDTDKENLWISTRGGRKRVRLVEHWYKLKGAWTVCFYAGEVMLRHEPSPYVDAKGKAICRYFPLRNKVDPDGVTHGYFRRMKGPQDALNQHRSKAVHIMNTNQLIIHERSATQNDPELLRLEASRPDGIIRWEGDASLKPEFRQMDQQFIQQTNYYQDAKAMLETFGPSSVAISGGADAASGRALTQMVQAGMAQIGPFLANIKNWRLRMYRALWVQQQRNWTAERIVRVTNDEQVAQFRTINKASADEFGRPILVDAIGQVDVDIILDEGPDSTNVMADVFDILMGLVQNKVPVPPAVLIKMSALPQSEKEELIGLMTQPDPMQQQAQQVALADKSAQVQQKQADAAHKIAQAKHIDAITGHAEIQNIVDMGAHQMDREQHTVDLGQQLGMLPQTPPSPQPPQPVQQPGATPGQ